MAKKNYFDFSQFDEVGDAMDLFANTIRNAFEFDALAGKDTFNAVVLTQPIPMDESQIASFIQTKQNDEKQSADDDIPRFTFKARILGQQSPHLFLPDPCDITIAKEIQEQQNIQDVIDMHTTVIAINAVDRPALGDVVKIKIDQGTFSINPQTAEYVGLVTNSPSAINNILGSQRGECKQTLENTFAGYNGSVVQGGKPIRDLSRLDKQFRQIVETLVQKLKNRGFTPYVAETFRTPDRQRFLYNIGQSKIESGGMHEKGLAVDIIDGRPHEDGKGIVGWGSYEEEAKKNGIEPTEADKKATKDANEFFDALGQEARELNLVWGGDWKTFIDKPHVEMSERSEDA